MSQRPFLTYSGDMRCAPITAYSTGDKYVAYLANNDMGELRNTYPDDARGGLIMQWDVFYTAIQDANILLAEIDKVPGMDGLKRSRFKAEAIFMRNLSYFFIVRAFGDVPYYTNAYNEAPLPRTNMVICLQIALLTYNLCLTMIRERKYYHGHIHLIRAKGLEPPEVLSLR